MFYLFRKKRTFNCWRRNMREIKQKRAKDFLARRLFSANEIFQRVILHVRMLCERASSYETVESPDKIDNKLILFITYDPNVTMNLSEFKDLQMNQIEDSLIKLYAVKEEIMNVTYISCIVS
jgi:uncharacterized protein (DUF488 family)